MQSYVVCACTVCGSNCVCATPKPNLTDSCWFQGWPLVFPCDSPTFSSVFNKRPHLLSYPQSFTGFQACLTATSCLFLQSNLNWCHFSVSLSSFLLLQELIPLILCTACLHPEPKERDQLLHILFNLIKRPDDEQRCVSVCLFVDRTLCIYFWLIHLSSITIV